MAHTLLMTAVLVVGFGLMFALVKFAEGIITRDPAPVASTVSAGKAVNVRVE